MEEKAESFEVSATSVALMVCGEVLSYWTSQKQVCINLTLFNRLPLHPQINDILGDFTVLELFNYEKSRKAIGETVKTVHDQLWADIDNNLFDGIDFQRLIREKEGVSSDIAIAPIVFTSLGKNLFDDKGQFLEDSFEGSGYSIIQTSQVYIDNKAYETTAGFVTEWDYVEQLFDRSTIETMHKMYCTLLERLSEMDWTKDFFPKIAPSKEDILLVEVVNSEQQSIEDKTIVEKFEKIALRKDMTNSTAVIDDNGEYTYSELLLDTKRLASHFTLIEEELIGILSEKGYNQVVSTLSVMKSGHAYLPLNVDWPEERIEEIALSSGVETLLISRKTKELKKFSKKFNLLVIEDLLKNAVPLNDQSFPKVKPVDIAYVIYTSGSTGKPKGVAINHVAAINTINAVNHKFNIDKNDTVLAVSELSFDLSVYDIFGLLFAGGKIIFPKQELSKNMGYLRELIDKYEVTIWNTVPQLADLISDEFVAAPNHSMHLFLVSRDKVELYLPKKLKMIFPGVEIYSLGGATEGSIWSIWYDITEVKSEWNAIPYGRAMPNQKMYVLTEEPEYCIAGVRGEIYIGGIGVAVGYWKNEKLTKDSFIDHPKLGRLYKTGDLGRWNKAGYIEFLGRKDTQLKLNGYRLELGEIETKISALRGIEKAVASTIQINNNNFIVAYVVPKIKFNDAYPKNVQSFKIEQHGIFHELENVESVPVSVELREDLYRLRKSYRNFIPSTKISESVESVLDEFVNGNKRPAILGGRADKDKLVQLLSRISAVKLDDRVLPKYRYPSAGSSYSVRRFLNISEENFGIAEGYYYYNPVTHRLYKYKSAEKTSKDKVRLDLVIYKPAKPSITSHFYISSNP